MTALKPQNAAGKDSKAGTFPYGPIDWKVQKFHSFPEDSPIFFGWSFEEKRGFTKFWERWFEASLRFVNLKRARGLWMKLGLKALPRNIQPTTVHFDASEKRASSSPSCFPRKIQLQTLKWWMYFSHENGRKGWAFFVAHFQVIRIRKYEKVVFESWDPFHQITSALQKQKKNKLSGSHLSFSAQEWNLPSRLLPQGVPCFIPIENSQKSSCQKNVGFVFVDWKMFDVLKSFHVCIMEANVNQGCFDLIFLPKKIKEVKGWHLWDACHIDHCVGITMLLGFFSHWGAGICVPTLLHPPKIKMSPQKVLFQ